MNVVKAGPSAPVWLAAAIVGLAIGLAGGLSFAKTTAPKPATGGSPNMRAPGGSPAGGPGGAAEEHANLTALTRTVGGLTTLETARGKGLTPDQRAKLAPLATSLKTDAAMTDAECADKLKMINAILTPDQTQVITDLTARPGGGRGGGAGGPAGAAAQPDFDHPFKAGRNKDRLQALVDLLKKP